MLRNSLLVVTVGLLLAADAKDDAVQKELKIFEGTWKIVSIEVEGQKAPEAEFKASRLTCKGDQFTFTDGTNTYKGTFKVDVAKKPKTIDLLFTEGPEKGKTALGIYELDADTYKLCIDVSDKGRPKEFAGKQGTGHVFEVLKKDKP